MMYIIYLSLEYLIKRINSCNNKPEKSNATNLGENIAGMQCLRYGHHGHLMEWKINIMYKEVKTIWKICVKFNEDDRQWRWFTLKIKNNTINKETLRTTWKVEIFYICKGKFMQKYNKDRN